MAGPPTPEQTDPIERLERERAQLRRSVGELTERFQNLR